MIKYLFPFSLLTCSYSLKAQHGYYITLEGDTVAARYKLEQPGYFSFKNGYNLYEKLPVLLPNGKKKIFTAGEIKGFYIQWKDTGAYFIGLYLQYEGHKFYRKIAVSPGLDVYAYMINEKDGPLFYALDRKAGSIIVVEPEITLATKNKLKDFFAGNGQYLAAMDGLFTLAGYGRRDMRKLVERIFGKQKRSNDLPARSDVPLRTLPLNPIPLF